MRLPQYLSEAFRECLCRFSHYLTGEDITNGVHHDLGFFVPIVTHQLAKILKTQAYRNIVASCRCDKVVQSLEIDSRLIIRASNVTERSLVTTCQLLNSSRSDDNPNGFTIEGLTIIENKDLKTVKR